MMKKSLLALGAFAAAQGALAQSSVTVFGVLDTSVIHAEGSGPNSGSRTQLGSSGNSFSRLGFRGTEDLGGGYAAGFWLEAGLQSDTGSGIPTNTNNQISGIQPGGLAFSRRSTVSLSGPFGELRLGRDYTPTFWNTALFDPFGTGGGIGANHLYFVGQGGLGAYIGTRASNSVGYFLPQNLGGFYGQVMAASGENVDVDGQPNVHDGDYVGGRLGWRAGGFDIAGATGRAQYASGDLTLSNLGVAYTFAQDAGFAAGLKLMAEYHEDKLGERDGKGGLLGFKWPVGPGMVKGSYAYYERDAAPGATQGQLASSKLALGYEYFLSKRTSLYATVARIHNDDGTSDSLGGVPTTAGRPATGTEFGITHVF